MSLSLLGSGERSDSSRPLLTVPWGVRVPCYLQVGLVDWANQMASSDAVGMGDETSLPLTGLKALVPHLASFDTNT